MAEEDLFEDDIDDDVEGGGDADNDLIWAMI